MNRALPLLALLLATLTLTACPSGADQPQVAAQKIDAGAPDAAKTPDAGAAQAPDAGAAQAPDAGAAAKGPETGKVTVYSGRKQDLVGELLAKFEQESGVKVEVKYGETQDLAAAVLQEGEKSPADVFFAQDVSSLLFLKNKGVFRTIPQVYQERITQADWKDAGGTWVATSGRARVLAYNTDKVKAEELPKDLAALTEPKWKGRVGWAPENASFKSFVSAMLQLQGPEKTEAWLKGMLANEPKAYPKNGPAVQAVNKGEVDVALVNHYYLFRVQNEEGKPLPVKNHYFRNGGAESMVNLSGVGILKTAKHHPEAEALVRFLLSDEAQKFFATKTYEFPVVPGVPASEDLPALDTLSAPKLDHEKLDNLAQTDELLKKVGALP
jgi:iron(III) transport system substrate-binding protein